MPRRSLSTFALLVVLVASGCSLLAKKTPTPAARIDEQALAQTPPPPNERYFLMMFGSQNALHQPKYSHTWATLVRAIYIPGNPEPMLEVNTISWLPTKIDINPLSRHVEPGANLELHATIKNALDTRQKIAMWGPYEVSHGFAYRFRVQKDFLDSGEVGYQCNDVVGEAARTGDGCDCIHAVSDMDPAFPRWRYPLSFFGTSATSNLVRRFMHSPITIDGDKTHDWLLCRLGLNDYPIEHRTYRGKIVPYVPGSAGLQDGIVGAPKEPTPKTAPGVDDKRP